MSRLVSRILLTVLIFPSATLVLFVSLFFFENFWPHEPESLCAASILSALYMAAYWLVLWRGSVVWTAERVQLTLLCAVLSAGLGVVLGIALSHESERWAGVMFGSLTAAVLWIIGTIWTWRETREERTARIARAGAETIVCPHCGYNLTGLREARCPECGAAFTLNELFAAQPGRGTAEIESGGTVGRSARSIFSQTQWRSRR